MALDERDFEKKAGATLSRLFSSLEQASEDLDVDLADGILTVEFEDGAKFIINSHAAAQQIWLSANMAASHFGWHEPTQSWRDTKTGAELVTEIGRLVAEKLSQPVVLRD
jgi:CyaY protein